MDWIKLVEAGPTALVAIVAIWLFLDAFKRWDKTRGEQRTAFLEEIKRVHIANERATDHFIGAIVLLVNLAHIMVVRCQGNTDGYEKITPEDIRKASMYGADIDPEAFISKYTKRKGKVG